MRHKEKSLEYQGFSAGDRLDLFECAVLSFAGDERELTDVSERATVCAYIARASRIYENAPSRQGRPRIARQFIGGNMKNRLAFVPLGTPANSPPIHWRA